MAAVIIQEAGQTGDAILRKKFLTPDIASESILSERISRYLESVEMFFIATSNAKGECDASFRGRQEGARPLRVLDKKTIVFPDYLGNGTFRSLGNILENPHIGMLFIDLRSGLRIRINGRAEVTEDSALRELFPGSIQVVKVTVDEIYKQNRPVSSPRVI